MHIMDGVLSVPVLAAGSVAGIAGIGLGIRKLKHENIPAAGLLTAVFFAASMIRFPIGISSVHLLFGGLLGVFLGWAAFPAIFIGLLLQMLMLGFGGWTTLAVNTFNIASPGVAAYYVFGKLLQQSSSTRGKGIWGFLAGFLSVIVSSLLVALGLMLSDMHYLGAVGLEIVAHLPVAVAEGLVAAFLIIFLSKVEPGVFECCTPCRDDNTGEIENK